MYLSGTWQAFMLCISQSLTVLGNVTCMSRNSAEVTLPFLHASLIFEMTKCMASVVHLPVLPPNWVSCSKLNFSVMWWTSGGRRENEKNEINQSDCGSLTVALPLCAFCLYTLSQTLYRCLHCHKCPHSS